MKYHLKAHPTRYRHVLFRSRLEARWAAFFDLVGWAWLYEPYDLDGWTPDFEVTFPCGHSECSGSHTLLVEVKPYANLEMFKGHPALDYPYGGIHEVDGELTAEIPADSSAAFGYHPSVSWWEMGHGAGGGEETVYEWLERQNLEPQDVDALWEEAGLAVRYQPQRR